MVKSSLKCRQSPVVFNQSNCIWKAPPPTSLGIMQKEVQQSHEHWAFESGSLKKGFLTVEKYFPGAEDSVSEIKQKYSGWNDFYSFPL